MCMGGGNGSITMPDTAAYDQQFNAQKAAMQSAMESQSMQLQSQLNTAIQEQQNELRRIADAKTQKANDAARVNQEVMRLTQMIGTPEPEKTAQAPKVGDDARYGAGKKGKKALRIGRRPNSAKQGVGLTISSGGY